MEKTKTMLADLQTSQQALLEARMSFFPPEVVTSSPKISRGETYQGLPWLMLDYPRIFDRENCFAIRTFFWWGNFFSVTLQLAGIYRERFMSRIVSSHAMLGEQGFYICVHEDPWQHHFEPDNYRPISGMEPSKLEEIMRGRPFVKLAKKLPLQQWEDAEIKLLEIYGRLADALADQLPSR